MENNRFIAVEGNIGVGKTTLTKILARHFGAEAMLEQFVENPFLDKFYTNPEKYAFLTEMYFMSIRYKQVRDFFGDVGKPRNIVSDYFFNKCFLFAQCNLDESGLGVYRPLFEMLKTELPKPDVIVYLRAPMDKIVKNIQVRNRGYEQTISKDYLTKIEGSYEAYFKEHDIRPIVIDASNADFIHNPSHVSTILKALDEYGGMSNHYTLA